MPALSTAIADSPAGKALSSDKLFGSLLQENLKSPPPDTEVQSLEQEKPDAEPLREEKPSPAEVEQKNEPAKPDKAPAQTKEAAADKKEPAKPDANTQKPPTEEKKGVKLSELPKDQQDFVLKASQQRQLDAFNAKNERIKALEGELEPLKAQLAELNGLKETAPKELEQLRAEVEKLRSENSEYDGKVKAFDVQQTREYRQSVRDPWDKQIIGEVDEKGVPKGGLNLLAAQLAQAGHKDFDAHAALAAINAGDEMALETILNSLPTDRARLRLSGMYDEAQKLIGKHRELTANSGDALKAIQEKQTQAEKQAAEHVKAEVVRIGSELHHKVAAIYPFLNGKTGNERLDADVAKAFEELKNFDVVTAPPNLRAEAAHARAFAPIIVNHQMGTIQELNKQLVQKDEEHAKVETELREQIAALEERVGNMNGETTEVQPTGRDGKGRFAKTEDSIAVYNRLMAGKV